MPYRQAIFDQYEEPPQNDFHLKGVKDDPKDEEEEELEAVKLNTLDLDSELSQNYSRAKRLYQTTTKDRGAKASEKANVLRVCSSILREITGTQEALHNVQRLKGIELALIATLKEFPEVKERFLEIYEGKLIEEDTGHV